MQALYLLALDPIAETTADPNSYGFRRERSTADAIGQCFCDLGKKASAPWVLEADIRACFDHISHEWLLAHIPMEKRILRQWLKAGYMEKDAFHPTDAGTPQGGVISPVLANLALDGLERELRRRFGKQHWKQPSTGINLVRYADDLIVTGRSKEVLENQVRPFVEQFLNERGLELAMHKTRVTHIDEGFDFLGQNLRKYKGKLIIKPAKKNVRAFLAKVRRIIKTNRASPAGQLIQELNPVIRGWTQLPPACLQQRDLSQGGSRHLSGAMALGQAPASQQGGQVGTAQVLSHGRQSELGVQRSGDRPGGETPPGEAAVRLPHANPTPYQDESGRESLRPQVGALL